MPRYDIVVIGAGAAGIMAAGKAASLGSKVLLVEKMEKPLRKLRITGKGRANITNTKSLEAFLEKVHPESTFLRPALAALSNHDFIQFINHQGVPTVAERGDRVFPASQKAWDVAEALVRWALKQGVTIECHTSALRVVTHQGAVQGVALQHKQGTSQTIECQAAIVATGGLSYPATGSTGDGYKLAKACGHSLVPTRPSLVPLDIEQPIPPGLAGLALRNVQLTLRYAGQSEALDTEFGELLLTPTGISGPITLRISRNAVDAYRKGGKVMLELDLKPALSHTKLTNRLLREIENPEVHTLGALLRKLMPAALIPLVLQQLKAQAQQKINEAHIEDIARKIKHIEWRMSGFRPFEEAIVTAGGIPLAEVEAESMMSRKIRNLYFAGELLDLDADTGGYNLQIAFSTGWLAGICSHNNVKL